MSTKTGFHVIAALTLLPALGLFLMFFLGVGVGRINQPSENVMRDLGEAGLLFCAAIPLFSTIGLLISPHVQTPTQKGLRYLGFLVAGLSGLVGALCLISWSGDVGVVALLCAAGLAATAMRMEY
ncbi:MAG: hypothetical protein GY717_14780 [Rhodobacteraceae bacterium]|nr:hypothetical protein [Paracoccaceae bacterium]